ncbi:peptidoglycan-binding protein [Phenylobacterium sp.]|uniref:peptidoglycan-binding protein n=1 Tax=Phenylobacterium sp. TaxID=1871053 RepID=UPI002BA85E29|nr:peptidoglycan-binding protein [Phenylobacterium sp.]HVI31326.1 peptidoglycan-binding protein [Phenylobacterium sp.]
MTAGAPWSVKGIDPKAREVAKDLARRSGMTLGEWLNRVILEDDVPEDVTSEDHFNDRAPRASFEPAKPRLVASTPPPQQQHQASRTDDLARVAYALDRLTDRIESSETRTSLAISGVEHSVRAAVARIEAGEREHVAVAARFESAVDQVGSEQSRLADRLRRMESESTGGPRSAEALRVLEQSVTRVADHVYSGEARTREALAAMEARVARAEAIAGGDPAPLIEEVVRRLGQRLADAEGRTAEALESLRASLATLDGRLGAVEGAAVGDAEHRLETLAAGLSERVEAARAEIAEKLAATATGRVDERFAELASQVQAAEQRSAQAIERMGREVISVAEAFNRRLQASETRSAEAIASVGGEMARIAGAVEHRLGRAEQAQADALEKLGAEIGRITERLTDRMLQSERRAAQAIDDVGEQVSRVTERIEQRHERVASDIAERLRQSEERTSRLLDEASERLEQRLNGLGTPVADDRPLKSMAAFGPELFSRAEALPLDEPVAERPTPLAEDIDAEAFAPIPEPEEDIFGLDQPEPPPPAPEPVTAGPKPLSTREVIDQARAAARAAEASRPRLQVKARANWRAQPKPPMPPKAARARPNSTLQTAFMIAGGAAFLSVGAAGMVLMNAGGAREAVETSPFGAPPRAAVAIAPQPIGPSVPAPVEAAPVEQAAEAPPAVPLSAQYLEAVRAVEKGEPGALGRMKAIADSDYAPAQFYMGKLYESGQRGVTKNLVEARRWTTKAAINGEPRGMHNLALYYFEGTGGPQDLASAARWFKKAAELGVGDSQYNLGLLYQAGSGVPRDLGEAYKWFSIAAGGGDAAARASAIDLEAKLNPAQLAAADQAAQAFRPASATQQAAAAPVSVASAQRILGRLGYYKGPANGAASREFSLAVSAYQRDQGLAATGTIDRNTAQRLSVFTR